MRPARRLLATLRLAFMLLSRLPVGRVAEPLPLSAAFWAYPLVGAVLGLLTGLIYAAAFYLGLPPLAAAILAVGAGCLLSGGLHEDGFADTIDGVFGGKDRLDALRIMKDSRIGSHAVCGLVLALSLRIVLLSALLEPERVVLALLALQAASRGALPLLMVLMPSAHPEGLGAAAARDGSRRLALLALALGLGLAALAGQLSLGFAVALGLGPALAAALAWRRLRGITGDVLGFALVITELALLMALLASPG